MVNLGKKIDEKANKPVGIVHLGRAAGKVKFAIVDEEDLNLVQDYHLEARLCIDRSGTGSKIIAFAVPLVGVFGTTPPLQQVIWTRRNGELPADRIIAFHNNISLDCRLENLYLCAKVGLESFSSLTGHRVRSPRALTKSTGSMSSLNSLASCVSDTSSMNSQRASPSASNSVGEPPCSPGPQPNTIYTSALRQLSRSLPPEATEEPYAWYGKTCDERGLPFSEYGGASGPDLSLGDPRGPGCCGGANPTWNWVLEDSRVYECHNPACCNLEEWVHQFSVCGRCHSTRYCCVTCQQEDWPRHKILCRAPLSHLGPSELPPARSADTRSVQPTRARNLNHVNVITLPTD